MAGLDIHPRMQLREALFERPMLFFSLVVVSVVLAITNSLACMRRPGIHSAILVALLFCFVSCMGDSPLYLYFGLFLIGAGVIARVRGDSPKVFGLASVGAAGLAYAIMGVYVLASLQCQEELRKKLPMESLADRLAYQRRVVSPFKQRLASTAPAVATAVSFITLERLQLGLGRLEAALESAPEHPPWESPARRARVLARLHESYLEQFINSPGFGSMRSLYTPEPSGYRFLLLPSERVPMSTPDVEDLSAGAEQASAASSIEALRAAQSQSLADRLLNAHQSSYVDFANPIGFGYVQDRDHVVGFQAHQFRHLPALSSPPDKPTHWQVRRVELVSLLKFEQPGLYISEYLPRMDDLRDAPTRPLNGFERRALAELVAGADLRIVYTSDRIRMLGSVRAVKQCLQCHEAQRGDLLGAFSYVLAPDPQSSASPLTNKPGETPQSHP